MSIVWATPSTVLCSSSPSRLVHKGRETLFCSLLQREELSRGQQISLSNDTGSDELPRDGIDLFALAYQGSPLEQEESRFHPNHGITWFPLGGSPKWNSYWVQFPGRDTDAEHWGLARPSVFPSLYVNNSLSTRLGFTPRPSVRNTTASLQCEASSTFPKFKKSFSTRNWSWKETVLWMEKGGLFSLAAPKIKNKNKKT